MNEKFDLYKIETEVNDWWDEHFGIRRKDVEKLAEFDWDRAFDLDYLKEFYLSHLK